MTEAAAVAEQPSISTPPAATAPAQPPRVEAPKPTPGSKAWAEMRAAAAPAPPAPRAGVIADSVYQSLPADQQGRYANVRKAGDQGGSEWVARDQLAADSGIKPDGGAQDGVHKFGDVEFSEQEMRDFLTAKGEAELRKASLPASPADYKAELPANFEMPGGVKFEINEADPLLIDARAWAHGKGMDQATFSEMVGLYAGAKAQETAQLNAAHAAEVAKMGANGTSRVTALETWLRGIVGDKLAGPMRSMMVTADIVKGLETLQQKFSSQGAASFSQAHREPRDPAGRVSDEEHARMTPGQRLDYARGFDQRQFAGGQ